MYIPPGETIIETRKCQLTWEEFFITDKDAEFYSKVSPTFNGKKYLIPFPTLCPQIRERKRMAWRNERKLYKRICGATGKDIVSLYSPDVQLMVYSSEFWWSDHWDALRFGREFDVSKSALVQLSHLIREVPRPSLYTDATMDNSAFCNYGSGCKDSYLSINCYNIQNALYCDACWPTVGSASDIVDATKCTDSSHVYMSSYLENCFKCFWCFRLSESRDCILSEHLTNCSRCLGCVGLSGANNRILNVEVSPEEFDRTWQKYLNDEAFRVDITKRFAALDRSGIESASVFRSENCQGEWIYDSQNVTSSQFIVSTENAKYCRDSGYHTIGLYDALNAGNNSAGLYEAHHVHASFQAAFLQDVDRSRNAYYSQLCYDCSDIFLCVGLKNKQYCILNRQYSQSEYEELVPQIIQKMVTDGEWGEFFPASMSPFGYNESVANEYYPLTKDEALRLGFNWSDYEAPFPKTDKVIPWSELPESIQSIPDDVLNWAIRCEISGRLFRIVPMELAFYRKHSLPIPRRHPDERYRERIAKRT